MYGAILGDMIGAPYEFDRGAKVKDFPLFSAGSHFTDDSVMTVAVAEALMATLGKDEKVVKMVLIDAMQRWGRKYPDAGYGARFQLWLEKINPSPYGSYGNGSAMRVSAAGWLYDSLEETRRVARWTAEVTGWIFTGGSRTGRPRFLSRAAFCGWRSAGIRRRPFWRS